jgi:hypothetical protein
MGVCAYRAAGKVANRDLREIGEIAPCESAFWVRG